MTCSLIVIVVLASCFLFMPIIMLCHLKKKLKYWKYTSPNITPSEKAFKHTEALLPQLVQVLALIIICYRK